MMIFYFLEATDNAWECERCHNNRLADYSKNSSILLNKSIKNNSIGSISSTLQVDASKNRTISPKSIINVNFYF